MRKVLMIAFHYPPYQGGSGIHRSLKFSRYLRGYGWHPIVLSAHPRAYPKIGDHQLREIPLDVIVERAFALDTAKHLSFRGRYLRLLALPDQWVSWWAGAVCAGETRGEPPGSVPASSSAPVSCGWRPATLDYETMMFRTWLRMNSVLGADCH